MEFIRRHRARIIAFFKTVVCSPAILILSAISGIARISVIFLLPSLATTLIMSLAASTHPLFFISVAILSCCIGLGCMIFNCINLYRSREHIISYFDFRNPAIIQFYDLTLLSLTFIVLGALAIFYPISIVNFVSQISRAAISITMILYYQFSFSKFCYRHILQQEEQFQFQQSANSHLQDGIDPERSRLREVFVDTYHNALEKLPQRLKDVIDSENIQREYLGTITRDLAYSPVKIRQSPTDYIYERETISNYFIHHQNNDPGTNIKLQSPELVPQEQRKLQIRNHVQSLTKWIEKNSNSSEVTEIGDDEFIREVYPE